MPRAVHVAYETLSLKLRTDLEIHVQEIGLKSLVKKIKKPLKERSRQETKRTWIV